MIECFEALGPCRFDHWAEPGEVSDWGYEYEPGEPVGKPLKYVEILNVATEEGQAGNTYDAVYYVLHPDTCSEELLADYGKLDVGLTRINLPNSRGFIEPVTASNESKDGGKSTFIVADETHLWIPPANGKFKLGKMHQTMVRNLLKRKIASGWMLETSTMYAEGERSVAEGTHLYAKQLAKAGRTDGKLLFDHRQASESWNLNKRSERMKALREAYGPAAAWMDLNAIADYWDDPQSSEADFRRFWLNQPVPINEKPPSVMPSWEHRAVNTPAPPAVALGISSDLDQTWLSLGAKCGTGPQVHVGSVYRIRVADGGRKKFVAEVKRIKTKLRIPVGIDPKGPASFIIDDLEKAGVKLVKFGLDDVVQAHADMVDGIESGGIVHGNYDDLNAAVDHAGWRSVGKRRVFAGRTGEISSLEAAAIALRTDQLAVPAVKPFALWG